MAKFISVSQMILAEGGGAVGLNINHQRTKPNTTEVFGMQYKNTGGKILII